MSALVVEEWEITCVQIDPDNERLFTRMDDSELDLLAASIREVGIIQPITVRSDGRIIAGEQRYRAALRAQLPSVPVIVRSDLTESEVERIRIHENLMRRGLKPSEQARGIHRLYELNGIQHGGDMTKTASRNLASVAEQIGWAAKKASLYNTLSNLIPELAERWDKSQMTRDVAYQVAQLHPLHQARIALLFEESEKVPDLRQEIAQYKHEITRIQATEALPPEERELMLEEELVKLRLAHQREVDALTFDLDDAKRRGQQAEAKLSSAERWADGDAVHRTLGRMGTLTGLDPRNYVENLKGFEVLDFLLKSDLEIAEGVQDWLRRYAHALRERLGMEQQRISEVRHVPFKETGAHR